MKDENYTQSGQPLFAERDEFILNKKTPPGRYLMKARLEIGFTIDEAAAHLNLLPTLVEAMEGDDYSKLPGTYARGYLRNYARLLNLSEEGIVACYNSLELIDNQSPVNFDTLNVVTVASSSRFAKASLFFLTGFLLAVGGFWLYQHRDGLPTYRPVPTTQNKHPKKITAPKPVKPTQEKVSSKPVEEKISTTKMLPLAASEALPKEPPMTSVPGDDNLTLNQNDLE